MRTRIGARLIFGSGLVVALTIGGMAGLVVRAHRADLIQALRGSANQLGETVKASTYYDMLENRRENLHRQIQTIGRQEGIEKVRLFNKDGQIMFSSDSAEIGKWVDKHAEACYVCHAVDRPIEKLPIPARARIFKGPEGNRVLGIINPIHNVRTCSSAPCHAHDEKQTVLGVLDVTVSLAEVDREIAATEVRMVGLAILAITASSLILWWMNRRLVLRPVSQLIEGTKRVAEGDLTTTIPVTVDHELGSLARAFNDMTRRLGEAQGQLTQAEKLASLGRLAAGVAHEINNPLTGVLTYASYVLKRARGNPELAEDVEVIVRETKRCREIVKELLDFARQTPPKRQAIDLNEIARRAVSIVMNELRLHHVSLTLDLQPDLPPVMADPNQMQQVIVNLLVNATDAIGATGGSIRLSCSPVLVSPWGHIPVRHATCPRGCELLDPAVKIGGLPSIRVNRSCRARKTPLPLHVDPVYGRFFHLDPALRHRNGSDHDGPEECAEKGTEALFSCPWCAADLGLPDKSCPQCGGHVWAVVTPGKGRVEWCCRRGCLWSRWEAQEAEGKKRGVELAVADNGRGIPPSELPHLFEPFFSTKGTHGTGLGLAVTWGIVEAHGGTIDVCSEVGKGTQFIIRLPLGPAATEVDHESTPDVTLAGAENAGRLGRASSG
jgi:two-component system NtrC family sensor kinase